MHSLHVDALERASGGDVMCVCVCVCKRISRNSHYCGNVHVRRLLASTADALESLPGYVSVVCNHVVTMLLFLFLRGRRAREPGEVHAVLSVSHAVCVCVCVCVYVCMYVCIYRHTHAYIYIYIYQYIYVYIYNVYAI